jgi:hypothetical protein
MIRNKVYILQGTSPCVACRQAEPPALLCQRRLYTVQPRCPSQRCSTPARRFSGRLLAPPGTTAPRHPPIHALHHPPAGAAAGS